jgi:F-box-like
MQAGPAFNDLPRDVLVSILGHLRPRELGRLAQVSRNLCEIADSDVVWAPHCHLRQSRAIWAKAAAAVSQGNSGGRLKALFRGRFMNYDYVFNIAVVGEVGSGRETLLRSFLNLAADEKLSGRVFPCETGRGGADNSSGEASESRHVPFSVLAQSDSSGVASIVLEEGLVVKMELAIYPLDQLGVAIAENDAFLLLVDCTQSESLTTASSALESGKLLCFHVMLASHLTVITHLQPRVSRRWVKDTGTGVLSQPRSICSRADSPRKMSRHAGLWRTRTMVNTTRHPVLRLRRELGVSSPRTTGCRTLIYGVAQKTSFRGLRRRLSSEADFICRSRTTPSCRTRSTTNPTRTSETLSVPIGRHSSNDLMQP